MMEFLSQRGVQFTERNVSLDEEARSDLVAMGHRATPVTMVHDQKVVGFNLSKLKDALESAGL